MKKQWTLYLYYNGILIKRIRIDENEAPATQTYAINVYFKKKLFGSNKVGVIVTPTNLLMNDEKKKRTYWGVSFELGVKV